MLPVCQAQRVGFRDSEKFGRTVLYLVEHSQVLTTPVPPLVHHDVQAHDAA